MSYSLRRSVVHSPQVLISGRRPLVMRRRGMGDVLSDAQAALVAAGYQGVSCRTERVALPLTDPTTGRNYYDQNVCSAAGHTGGFMADVIARGGVDLAAERRSLERAGGGDDRSYFDGIGRGSTPLRYAYDPLPPGNLLNQLNQLPTNPNAPAARAVSVSLENTSRPGQGMRVGDQWTLRVSGSPNSDVFGWGEHNGTGAGESNFGKTDSQGVLTIRGQMKEAEVGQWKQRWRVNGMSADLSFTVQPRITTVNGSAPVNGAPETVGCAQVMKRCADGSLVGYDPAIRDACVYLPCPGDKPGGLDLNLNFDWASLAKSPVAWAAAAGVAFLVFGGRR